MDAEKQDPMSPPRFDPPLRSKLIEWLLGEPWANEIRNRRPGGQQLSDNPLLWAFFGPLRIAARRLVMIVGKLRPPSLNDRPTRAGTFDHFWVSEAEASWRQSRFGALTLDRTRPRPDLADPDHTAAYFTEEMGQLRTEIVDIKNRELTSERFSVFVTGAVFYVWYDRIVPDTWVLGVGLVAAIIGFIRFREYERNIFEIDAYLREIEHRFDRRGAWVSYFFMRRKPERTFYSRFLTWITLILIAGLIPIFAHLGLVTQKALPCVGDCGAVIEMPEEPDIPNPVAGD